MRTLSKQISTVRLIDIAYEFELFIHILEDLGRSRDCLNVTNVRNDPAVKTINNVETGRALSLECLDVVAFQRVCRSGITLEYRSKQATANSRLDVVVVWEPQHW